MTPEEIVAAEARSMGREATLVQAAVLEDATLVVYDLEPLHLDHNGLQERWFEERRWAVYLTGANYAKSSGPVRTSYDEG